MCFLLLLKYMRLGSLSPSAAPRSVLLWVQGRFQSGRLLQGPLRVGWTPQAFSTCLHSRRPIIRGRKPPLSLPPPPNHRAENPTWDGGGTCVLKSQVPMATPGSFTSQGRERMSPHITAPLKTSDGLSTFECSLGPTCCLVIVWDNWGFLFPSQFPFFQERLAHLQFLCTHSCQFR